MSAVRRVIAGVSVDDAVGNVALDIDRFAGIHRDNLISVDPHDAVLDACQLLKRFVHEDGGLTEDLVSDTKIPVAFVVQGVERIVCDCAFIC